MKKLSVFFVLLALAAIPALAQGPVTGPYLVSYFNTNAPGANELQDIRLVNFGAGGTPLSSPVGDVCANIYVFDANQEMVECCSCRITPNGVIRLSVGYGLTSSPVTGVIPVNGDIKILSTAANGQATCTPLTLNAGLIDSTVGFATHLQLGFPTEHQIPAVALSTGEQQFLPQACQFARYLGSGKGVCTCAVVG